MTYKFLILTAVRNADMGLASLVNDFEREVLYIELEFRVIELATDETLSIEDTNRKLDQRQSLEGQNDDARIVRVHGDLVLSSVTDQTLGVGERDVRRGSATTLVVGNDFNATIFPDADTTGKETSLSSLPSMIRENSRVGCAEIDTNSFYHRDSRNSPELLATGQPVTALDGSA